jgi:hypothetical protein
MISNQIACTIVSNQIACTNELSIVTGGVFTQVVSRAETYS